MKSALKELRNPVTVCAAIAAAVLLLTTASAAQSSNPALRGRSTTQPQEGDPLQSQIATELDKYPGLLPAFGNLLEKLRRDVQLPDDRRQSDLLPMLAPTTMLYLGMPNYGEAAHQGLTIFREELEQSAVLRDWWRHGGLAKTGPEIESAIEKFYELSQYLGEEIVVSGEAKKEKPSFLLIARLRKPGLKEFLEAILKERPTQSPSALRILDLKELAAAKQGEASEFVVLVRPGFVIAGSGLDAVRRLNGRLEEKSTAFGSTPFGRRLEQAYSGGTSLLAAGDLHEILSQFPQSTPEGKKKLEESGFDDVKYMVWNRKHVGDRSLSETELSFGGPRHGAAAWLAAPAPLGSLDFVSPDSTLTATMILKNLGEIFDEVKQLSAGPNPGPLAFLEQMGQALHINVRDDVFAQVAGEITIEVKTFGTPQPEWKAVLRVNDADHLQEALAKLLQTFPAQPRQFDEHGIHYHSFTFPSKPKPVEIHYAFVEGYMIVGSSHEFVAQAVKLRRSGESLAKSRKFLESLPPGNSAEASFLIYEDAAAMTAARFQQMSPEVAQALASLSAKSLSASPVPITFAAYGEPNAIRAVSASGGADAGAALMVAAIAIPNLLRARMAANESSAVSSLRTVNTAQIAYSAAYPDRGFAPDLATLGPDPVNPKHNSEDHAGYIDESLGCSSGSWCTKSGYRFTVKASCLQSVCRQYVALATPVSSNTGARSFCSVSDAVIRVSPGTVLTTPISAPECRRWTPLQ